MPNAAYTVSFLLSGDNQCPPTIKTVQVEAAGQSQTFTWDVSNGNDAEHGVFGAETFAFTGSSATTTLQFSSLRSKRSGCGPVVAAISVTQN